MADTIHRLEEYLATIKADLDRTVGFRLRHSHDTQFGGFFICLGEDGHVYDDIKYTWLESRQVWTYARLYNEVERYRTSQLLKAAEDGAKFIMTYMKRSETGKCYFALTRQGLPIKTQRSIFAECFYLMAMSELYRATGNDLYRREAVQMMEHVVHWVLEDDSGLGRERLPGAAGSSSLAVPMMLLCLVEQLLTMDSALDHAYRGVQQWGIEQVLKHVQRNGTVVLENVSLDGQELPGSAGRLLNPGHAIETGWFLLQTSIRTGDPKLQALALETFISATFQRGWDQEHGGLFYFLDADGESPVQLEWDMKLWWPHTEALVAMLMAYGQTRDPHYLRHFDTVFQYSYSRFVDKEGGDWFGYLNRRGEITHRFKGGPWKGCFHVIRALIMCEQMLETLIKDQKSAVPVGPKSQ